MNISRQSMNRFPLSTQCAKTSDDERSQRFYAAPLQLVLGVVIASTIVPATADAQPGRAPAPPTQPLPALPPSTPPRAIPAPTVVPATPTQKTEVKEFLQLPNGTTVQGLDGENLRFAPSGSTPVATKTVSISNKMTYSDIDFSSLPPEIQAKIMAMLAEQLGPAKTDAVSPGATNPADAEAAKKAAAEAAEQQRAALLLQKYVNLPKLQRSPGAAMKTQATAEIKKAAAEKKANAKEAGKEQSPSNNDATGGEKEADESNAATAQAATPPLDKDTLAAQQYQRQVIQGDWPAVKQHLETLPESIQGTVYNLTLALLLGKTGGIVLPDDVLAIADAAPAPLTDAQLAQLGGLLRASRKHVDNPSTLLDRLQSGTARLGGADPKRRLAAARMLAAAGMTKDAASFMPAVEKAIVEKDVDAVLLHAEILQRIGSNGVGEQPSINAWLLCQEVLGFEDATAEERLAAAGRCMALMPQLKKEYVHAWLDEILENRPDLGLLVVASVLSTGEMSYLQKDQHSRLEAMTAIHLVGTRLVEAARRDAAKWREPLQLMAVVWAREAGRTLADSSGMNAYQMAMMQRQAMYDEEMMISPEMFDHYASDSEYPAIDPVTMLSISPAEQWRDLLDKDIANKIRRMVGEIAATAANKEQTFALVKKISQTDRQLGQVILSRFVSAWANQIGSGRSHDIYNSQSYRGRSVSPYLHHLRSHHPGQTYYGNSGVSLTRAQQVRNIDKLAALLEEVKTISKEPLPANVLINAFDSCHSGAEVYAKKDIERALGKLESLPPEFLANLAQTGRQKLARQWRAHQVQEQAGTRRTDQQMIAEVRRGYDLMIEMLTAALAQQPDNPGLHTSLATLYFDQAEFQYGQNVDLKTYTSIRDRAFGAYAKAAELYAEHLSTAEDPQYDISIFASWFNTSLGASDLAYLTRQDRPDTDQIGNITKAIGALGKKAAAAHLEMFGNAVGNSLHNIPGQLKRHYLEQSLRVLGDHPSGESARKLIRYYDDLLGEVQLTLVVDGSSDVGHGRPFGAHLMLRSTLAVGRESNDFRQLLQPYRDPYTGQAVDKKELIEKELREKLTERFEIDSLLFHQATVDARRFGRDGWRETPLAYVVLRSKDASVDRIPPVQVDLDFVDQYGAVILPLRSQVVLVNSRASQPPARRVAELKIKQTLDDREIDKESVRLEIDATGKGIIGDLDNMLDVGKEHLSGLTIKNIIAHDQEVASLDTTGEEIQPVSRRSWVVELELPSDKSVTEFSFPTATAADKAEVSYERYADADIVTVASVVPLDGGRFTTKTNLWMFAVAGGIAVLVVVGFLLRRFLTPAATDSQHAYQMPTELTPFSLVVMLKRMHADPRLSFSAADRSSLGTTIEQLELRFFSGRETSEAVDLRAVLDPWLARTRNGHMVHSAN